MLHVGLVDGMQIVTAHFTRSKMQWCARDFGGMVQVSLGSGVSVLTAVSLESVTCNTHRTALSERDAVMGEEWTFGGTLIGEHGFCTASSTSCPFGALPPLQLGQLMRFVIQVANSSQIPITLACRSYEQAIIGDGSVLFSPQSPSFMTLAVSSLQAGQALMDQLQAQAHKRTTFEVQQGNDQSVFHLVFGRQSPVWRIVVLANAGISHGVTWKWFSALQLSLPIAYFPAPSDSAQFSKLPCSLCKLCLPTPSSSVLVTSGYFYSAGLRAFVDV